MIESTPSVFLFFPLWVLAWAPIAAILAIPLHWRPLAPVTPEQKIPLVLSLYAIAPLVLAGVQRWTPLTWKDCGIALTPALGTSFLLGLGLGVVGIGGLFGLYLATGWATLHAPQSPTTAPLNTTPLDGPNQAADPASRQSWATSVALCIGLLAVGIIVGGVEELIFRGLLTGQLAITQPLWLAGAIASAIFALLHLIWDRGDAVPQLPGLWVMGCVLTVAWWGNHQAIGIPWGLHAGWVWAIATIDTLGLIHYSPTAPPWGIGIQQYPLAGLTGMAALALTGVLLLAIL